MKFETKEDVALPQQVLLTLWRIFKCSNGWQFGAGLRLPEAGRWPQQMALHGTAHLNFAGVNAKLVFIWPNSVPPKKWCF